MEKRVIQLVIKATKKLRARHAFDRVNCKTHTHTHTHEKQEAVSDQCTKTQHTHTLSRMIRGFCNYPGINNIIDPYTPLGINSINSINVNRTHASV